MNAPQQATSTTANIDVDAVLKDYLAVTERLQATHVTLQREVTRLRDELASKDRELERRRRLAALGELAAGVAHEVRNPLGAIQLYSGLLRSELKALASADVLQLIDKIEVGIAAIDGVVHDTLALAPREGRTAECSIQSLVTQACDMCERLVQKHAVRLERPEVAADLLVAGQQAGLQRALMNLISNAIEASPAGTTVRVHVEVVDAQVRLLVADEGPGIASEVLDQIFNPFFTTKENGTGLGLSIAHRLVEAHGGELVARNRAAGGAEFLMTLPEMNADASAETAMDRRISAA